MAVSLPLVGEVARLGSLEDAVTGNFISSHKCPFTIQYLHSFLYGFLKVIF